MNNFLSFQPFLFPLKSLRFSHVVVRTAEMHLSGIRLKEGGISEPLWAERRGPEGGRPGPPWAKGGGYQDFLKPKVVRPGSQRAYSEGGRPGPP